MNIKLLNFIIKLSRHLDDRRGLMIFLMVAIQEISPSVEMTCTPVPYPELYINYKKFPNSGTIKKPD